MEERTPGGTRSAVSHATAASAAKTEAPLPKYRPPEVLIAPAPIAGAVAVSITEPRCADARGGHLLLPAESLAQLAPAIADAVAEYQRRVEG